MIGAHLSPSMVWSSISTPTGPERVEVHFQAIRGETGDTIALRKVEERKSRLDVHRRAEGEIRPRRRVETCEKTQAHQGRYDHRNLKQLHLRPSFLPEGNME
jgi:hypothetical protein